MIQLWLWSCIWNILVKVNAIYQGEKYSVTPNCINHITYGISDQQKHMGGEGGGVFLTLTIIKKSLDAPPPSNEIVCLLGLLA